MTEIMEHLSPRLNAVSILANYNCIPGMMPLITSQFLRRVQGRSTLGDSGMLERSRFPGTIVRLTGGPSLHGRVVHPVGTNRRLRAAWIGTYVAVDV
jgi:hypothetical protein